ncbi:MAG: hypothetical protein HFG69_16805 [Hungatella sp.]|nr:hypothetical protein [Hungatella sp.]
MKGTIYELQRKSEKDPMTGVEVIRLTDNRGNYDRPYFTTRQFDRAGRYTLFVSDFTGTSRAKNPDAPAVGKIGFGELFLLELETGKALQVTEGEAIKMGHGAHAMMGPDGKKAYYYSNEQLKEVDLETLESRELMWIPNSYNFHSLSITDDGRYLAFSVVEEMVLLTSRFADPMSEAAPGARERFFKEPGSLVIRYDTVTGTAEAVCGGHHRITHVSLMPSDGDRLLFCHDGPWHLTQRMWTARASTDEVKPLVSQQHNLEGIVHEFFTPGGRIGAQYSYRYKPDMDFFLFADLFVDFDGGNQERYYYPYLRPGHVSVNSRETLAAGDRAMIRKDMKDSERYLSLIRYHSQDHRAEVSLLCAHDTSGKKSAHVHPVFTPDDSHIVYSSDKEGRLNIYMVEADWGRAVR